MLSFLAFSVRRAAQGFWRNRVMSLAATVTMVLMLVLIVLERKPALMHAVADRLTAPLPEKARDRARHALAQFLGGLVMLVITAIGIMVPAAPGYIGTLNIAVTYGLALFDVPTKDAAAYSWFYWVGQWLPVTLLGLYFLRREGLSLRALGQAKAAD